MELYWYLGNKRSWYGFHFLIGVYKFPDGCIQFHFIWRTYLFDIDKVYNYE